MQLASSGAPAVLLAHSYYLRHDPKQVQKMRPYPPLATLITASVLRQHGIDVTLFDAMLASGVEEFYRTLDAVRPAVVTIVEDNFNFLTKMCTVRMRTAALDMVRAAGRAGARVAVNGSDATDHPQLYLDAGADAVIVGEVEPTVLDLVRAWRAHPNAPLDVIPGLVLPAAPRDPRRDDRHPGFRRTAARPALEDLDTLPFPAWDLVDRQGYRSEWLRAHGRWSWNLVASRGCPYRCNWCAKPLFGSRYTQRSPGHVAEELRRLRETVGPDHVWFADDIFGLTPQWIQTFAREVAARGARTPFTMQSRVNLMKPAVVEALASAGAEEVWLGVESGSQKILDAMDKGTDLAQIRRATRCLKAHGIRSCWFIQLGYLGEEWDDILLTRDLIRAEQPDEIGVSVSYPLPGTSFYQTVRTQLREKTNWEHSDDLAMMFAGTYDTDFYRSVRDLLHQEVRPPAAGAETAGASLDLRWEELTRLESRARRGNGRSLPVC
ncbi:MAG: B12-binding domain-containing radical SAM protein [Gemmatimonadetes bacterium]|nr:B12-binding domain-containing radical SAM protein [Gemmatimonadota bacterium]